MDERDPAEPAIGLDDRPVDVSCYVRADVSTASARQVNVVVDRLRNLQETAVVDDCSVREWPSEHRRTDADGASRTEIVSAFEDWAAREGYSLEPAFRRQTVHSSLLGSGETRTEIRVPLVSLALYDDSETLLGVVPYTDDAGETHTVAEWLSAAEERDRTTAQHDQPLTTPLEG